MKISKNRVNPLIVFLASFSYLAVSMCIGLNIYDEAITLVGAKSILYGLIPYKDFWTIYAPGQFYLLAAVFSIFGSSLLVERILTILIFSLFSTFIYFFLKKHSNDEKALVFSLIITIIIGYTQLYARSLPLALLFMIISIIFFNKYLFANNIRYVVYSGLFAALTTIFRHDLGIYLILAITLTFFLSYLLNKKLKLISLKLLWLQIAMLYLGIAIILAPLVFYFALNVPFSDIFEQLIYFPVSVFPEYRSIAKPIPFISVYGETIASKIQSFWFSIVFYLPFIIYAFSVIATFSNRKAKNISSENNLETTNILLIIIGLLLYNQAIIRADFEHLFPTLTISFLLFPLLFSSFSKIKPKSIILTLIIIFIAIIPFIKKIYLFAESHDETKYISLSHNNLKHIIIQQDLALDYQEIIDFLEENSGDGEKLFICNSRNDKIFINDLMLYFVLNRQPAVKYYELHPGLVTTKIVQNEIIKELDKKTTCFIIIRKEDEAELEKVNSEKEGSTVLDLYIKDHYKIAKELRHYLILIRKEPTYYQDFSEK